MEVRRKDLEAFDVFMELIYSHAYPNSFKAALDLKIPDILAAAGPGESLTPQQIADQLPRKSHDAAQKLGRILRLLAHKGIFSASDSEPTRFLIGDFLTCNKQELQVRSHGCLQLLRHKSEFDLNPFAVAMQRPEICRSFNHLREAVEDDANGFVLANGSDIWSYGSVNPDFNEGFNAAMRCASKLVNTVIARCYEGFKDVHCVVDVGGGVGGALVMIMAEHPHIRGRNFDLPQVIATAPSIPGVEHVPGSFLEFVPSGDVILLQHVLHNWGDEECVQILKNCHKALPQNGKVLIREHVIQPSQNSAVRTGAALNTDILMLTLFQGKGRERTITEWKRLVEAAGFSQISFLSLEGLDLIESVKT